MMDDVTIVITAIQHPTMRFKSGAKKQGPAGAELLKSRDQNVKNWL